ncbi:MAG: redox-sensing transcriptional repressor Rex [Clostridia bacterium]|nr:redox-sensing transcriptional repressor Rex [Clostridia bacterium]
MTGHSIPKATLGRLPQYLEYLRSLPVERRTISATAIAGALSMGDVQVRKDLAAVSGAGKPKVGYQTEKLIEDIEGHLGCDKLTNAVLVGAGKLGRALLDYDGFKDFGVRIIAGFDCNETVLKKGAKEILPIKDLGSYCRQHDVRLGIITVGGGSAQEVCDRLAECGIEAIWNFAPVRLRVPGGILLKQENLALSLAYLNNQISK